MRYYDYNNGEVCSLTLIARQTQFIFPHMVIVRLNEFEN